LDNGQIISKIEILSRFWKTFAQSSRVNSKKLKLSGGIFVRLILFQSRGHITGVDDIFFKGIHPKNKTFKLSREKKIGI
jgi:hypothetical protein